MVFANYLVSVLDEAFPEITVDLVSQVFTPSLQELLTSSSTQLLVDSPFDPLHLAALSHQISIPQSLMFMSCPGPAFPHSTAEFGTRIILL